MYNVIPINLETLNATSPNFNINEDALNLETDDVDSTEANRRLGYFQTNLLLNLRRVLAPAAVLSRDNVDFLYNKVKHRPTTNKKCLTGILVHFANRVNGATHEFHPLFQPVFLELKQYDPYSMTYIYETSFSDKCYHLDVAGTTLVMCVGDEEKNWRLDYGKFTTINHSKDSTNPFGSFITNVDSESQLFPFQLMYTLMDHNQADQITFQNCMSEFIHDPSVSLKHSMLLSSPDNGNGGPFFRKYANRSHLCPPCGRFGFTLNLQ